MTSGYDGYTFEERDLRLFMRGRTISRVLYAPSGNVEFKFTDGTRAQLLHTRRKLGKLYAPYFTVKLIKPNGRLYLAAEIKESMPCPPKSKKRSKKNSVPQKSNSKRSVQRTS
jgi:hypothetical protein